MKKIDGRGLSLEEQNHLEWHGIFTVGPGKKPVIRTHN